MGQKRTTSWGPLWITFKSYITLGKSFNLPKSQFFFLKKGVNFQYVKAPTLTSPLGAKSFSAIRHIHLGIQQKYAAHFQNRTVDPHGFIPWNVLNYLLLVQWLSPSSTHLLRSKSQELASICHFPSFLIRNKSCWLWCQNKFQIQPLLTTATIVTVFRLTFFSHLDYCNSLLSLCLLLLSYNPLFT